MSDFLLELSKNPQARRFIESLGLPLSLPEALPRGRGPWEERCLEGRRLAVYSAGSGELSPVLARTVIEAGASVTVLDGDKTLEAFRGPAEAWARPVTTGNVTEPPESKFDALICDATGFSKPDDLRGLYEFFHGWARRLDKGGRVVVLGRPADNDGVEAAATRVALEGFVRSLAKEVGRRGATANLVLVEGGAEERLSGTLRFLLNERSAFVTGQPLVVGKAVRPNKSPGFTHSLKGKVAVVTGAARGIGEATATRLAEEGAHVVCVDRPQEEEPVSQVARKLHGDVLLLDVSNQSAADKLNGFLREKHGGADIVVHNAGVTRDKTLGKMSPEAWDMAIDINLRAPVRLTRALVDDKLLREEGRVVCLSSVAGIAGNAGQTNYAASKAGLIGFVRALSAELAGRGTTVNAVAPGFIETKMTAAMPVAIREVARRLSALGQGGQPVDVAEAITFLSMPWADGISGRVLRVCGGAFIGA